MPLQCLGLPDRLPVVWPPNRQEAYFFAMRNITTFVIAWIILLNTSCLSCKDKNCPSFLGYYLPVTITPAKDTFNIGDTMTLSIYFPKKLIDKEGSIENTFENFDFRLEIIGSRYDMENTFTSTIFELTTQTGSDSLYSFGSFDLFRLTPDYDGEYYEYKGYMTLSRTGLYSVSVYCYEDSRINPFDISGNCDHVPVHFYCDVNEGQDNNVELVSPYNGNSTFWENQFKKGGGYAFVVR